MEGFRSILYIAVLLNSILISCTLAENCTDGVNKICQNGTYFNHFKQLCESCKLCRVGEGVRCPCQADMNTICERCSKGTFSKLDNNRHCTPCTKCRANEIQKAACNKTSDAVCTARENGRRIQKSGHLTYIWIIVGLSVMLLIFLAILIWATCLFKRGGRSTHEEHTPFNNDTDTSKALDVVLCEGSSFSSLEDNTRWRKDHFRNERSSFSSLEDRFSKSKDSTQSSLLSSDNYSVSERPSFKVLKRPDVLLSDLPASVYQELGKLLNPTLRYRDWQTLAGKVGNTQADIEHIKLRRTYDFTEAVLVNWCTGSPRPTIGNLYKLLMEIPREDAANVLFVYDQKAPAPSETTV